MTRKEIGMFTNEMKENIKMVLSAVVVALAITGIIHCFTYESKIKEAYRNGYQQAIYDAELVESSDTGYILSFNGEENWYTFN